jgi:hypothetical protein
MNHGGCSFFASFVSFCGNSPSHAARDLADYFADRVLRDILGVRHEGPIFCLWGICPDYSLLIAEVGEKHLIISLKKLDIMVYFRIFIG